MIKWFLFTIGLLITAFACYPGPAGVQGPQGPISNPGNNLTVVQFCAGQITQYPTSFPEQGICAQNQLYAVFWQNNSAWLGPVPPGQYLSTATGLGCNFTVLNGCQVQ